MNNVATPSAPSAPSVWPRDAAKAGSFDEAKRIARRAGTKAVEGEKILRLHRVRIASKTENIDTLSRRDNGWAHRTILRRKAIRAYQEANYRTCEGWKSDSDFSIKIGVPNAESVVCVDRSRGGSYPIRSSIHTITVGNHWLRDVQARGLAVVDGMMTLDVGMPTVVGGVPVYPAKWVAQGRGTELRVERGFIAYDGGVAVHGKTLKGASDTWGRRNARLLMDRANEAELSAYGDVRVSFALARAAGLCEAGIRDWCARHLPDVDPHKDMVPVSVLLALVTEDRRDLMLRAIKKAVEKAAVRAA